MAFAQDYSFRHYQVEQGLSHNTVFSITQDHKGFMWFATNDGLNKFDGISFTTFRQESTKFGADGFDFITKVVVDQYNQIWIGTENGIFKYNAINNIFEQIIFSARKVVNELAVDSAGKFWFVINGEAGWYDPKYDQWKVITISPLSNISTLCTGSDKQIWLGSTTGKIGRIEPIKETILWYNVFEKSHETPVKNITTLFDCGNNELLIGTRTQGVKIFNKRTGIYKDLPFRNADGTAIYVRQFIPISNSEYWAATESGILKFDIKTNEYRIIVKNYNNPYSLSDNSVYSLFKDQEGGIWASTFFGGINYYPKPELRFTKYLPGYTDNSLKGNAIREIVKDSIGNLWIGTEDAGLNQLNLKTGKVLQYLPGSDANSISHSNIHGLLVHNDELWIGTYHYGIDILDIKTKKIVRRLTTQNSALKNNFVLCFLKSRSGDIYIGSVGGLQVYNSKRGHIMPVKDFPNGHIAVFNILEDSNGTIWVSTRGAGLIYFNPASHRKGQIRNEATNGKSLSTNTLNSTFEDKAGNLWIATDGGGLCVLNKSDSTFTRYTTENGWPSNYVFSIMEDNHKRIWATTTKGLVCLTPSSGNIRIYTHTDGLLNEQFNYSSKFKDTNGSFYFGSVKGMVSFNPDSINKSTSNAPPVYITSFQISQNSSENTTDKYRKVEQLAITPKLILPYNHSTFSIGFAALSYTAPSTTEYAYIMKGLDHQWTYLKSNRQAFYTNLSPGAYTFQVTAATSNGIWAKPTQIEIIIRPPFWATTWAYWIYFIFAFSIIYFIIRFFYNRNQHKKKMQELRAKQEAAIRSYEDKMAFFTNLAHEIRTPLSLIKGPLERIMKSHRLPPELNTHLKRIEKNSNQLVHLTQRFLDLRKVELDNYHLHLSTLDIGTLLSNTFYSFKHLAEKEKINLQLHQKSTIITLADPEAMQIILNNLFTNSIKYAKSFAKIELTVASDDFLQIIFTSDGIKIPDHHQEDVFKPFFRLKENQTKEGTGIGLALAKSLAELHKGKLYISASTSEYNVFIVEIPLKTNGYKSS